MLVTPHTANATTLPAGSSAAPATPAGCQAAAVPTASAARGWRGWCGDFALVCGKDLALEWRSQGMTSVFLLMALLVLLAQRFAFPVAATGAALGLGALWLSVLFGSLLSLHRSFRLETELDALAAVRLSPLASSAFFLGKVAANFVAFAVLQGLLLAAYVLFYQQAVDARFWQLAGGLLLGTYCLSAVGTTLVALCHAGRGGELLLPVLLLPLVLPLTMALARYAQAIAGEGGAAGGPLRLLVGFAVMFTAAGIALFDHVVEE